MATFNPAESKFKQRNKLLTNAKVAATRTVSKCAYNQLNFNTFAKWYKTHKIAGCSIRLEIFQLCRHSFVDVGEALFEQSLALKYVLWLQRGLKFQNIAFLFYVWISLELIKLQGDLPQKWMTGKLPKSSSYPVCFRRRQNGVHQTLIIISSNGRKLSLRLKFD